MFFTFLNKEDSHFLDLSVLLEYAPEEVLFYYYDSFLKISLDSYLKIKGLTAENKTNRAISDWIEMIDDFLDAEEDLNTLEQSEYLDTLGPYYYPITNTRFYFTKLNLDAAECIMADDLATIIALHNIPSLDRTLQTYHKGRKATKKAAKNAEELLKDIEMCLACLKEMEQLHRHMNYLNKLLEQRYAIVEQEQLMPLEPDNLPVKPTKSHTDKSIETIVPFNILKTRPKKQANTDCSFNYEVKVYFIRYREYEKACDRYKEVLANWTEYYQDLMDMCFDDIEIAEEELKKLHGYLDIYNNIIRKSFVHSNYQDTRTLTIFKNYLETGRTSELQECMNLFEDEKHWDEIKASQNRIENTIFFLQSGSQNTDVDHYVSQLLKTADRPANLVKA